MNILVLNLPFESRIIRRYKCSYYARGFLYPPEELLRTATIIKEFSSNKTYFLDCIAKSKGLGDVFSFVRSKRVQVIVTMLSVNFVHKDYETIKKLKNAFPNIKVIGIGYIPSHYREEFTGIDYILDNLFEERIFNALKEKDLIKGIEKFLKKPLDFDPDIIDTDNRDLIKASDYSELFCRGKTAFLHYSFGCSFGCNYCIHAYDLKPARKRSKEKVFAEILDICRRGYKNIKFLDDNITLDADFILSLRNFVKNNRIKANFYGLSRIDLINEKTASLLKEANFRRLYIGVETFNKDLQKYYKKNINVEFSGLIEKFNLLRKKGIETAVWILYHPLKENKSDVIENARKLKKLRASFVNIGVLTPYPGTDIFQKETDSIRFQMSPFMSEFAGTENIGDIERSFFLSYLKSPRSFLRYAWLAINHPVASTEIVSGLFKFGKKGSARKDFI
ncbi:MAG TPA: radical SAM protein [Candidatus Woesearchaeota archaeon]|nr:radical SAM protein [Candidatus Woesearchaeota archaeon]